MYKEKWKRVKFDKNYLVSSWGRVYSLKNECLMTPELVKSRCDYYYRMNLPNHRVMLHVLVALHFKNTNRYTLMDVFTKKKLQVNHKNLNTLDCSARNLHFCTQEENIQHSHDNRKLNFNGKDYILRRRKDETN